MNIFVANINFKLDDTQLQRVFEAYGAVDSAKIITDKVTGKSKGYGFVEMTDDTEARKAIEELDGAEFEGRYLAVKEAKPRNEYKKQYSGAPRSGGRY